MELLARAVAHQAPEEFAREGAIRSLSVRIQAVAWDRSTSPPEKISMGVRRDLLFGEKEGFRSEWRSSVDTQVYGFDGTRYWYAEYDQGGALVRAVFLLGDKYRRERATAESERVETKYLLRLFFLANLRGPRVVFSVKPDEEAVVFGEKIPCRVLVRESRKPGGKEPPLTLWLSRKDLTLVKAKAHAVREGQKSLIFLFRYDERVQPRVRGVLVPYRMEIREQPFGARESRVSSRATLEENGISFNTPLDRKLFLKPRRE